MKDDFTTQSTAEVVEQLEEEQIDLKVVRLVAGEGKPDLEQAQWLEQLQKDRAEHFYSDLIFALLGRRYPHPGAQLMWKQILSHRNVMKKALTRNPGIVVAALDWLTNIQKNVTVEWGLIESGNLENMLTRAVVDGLTGLYDHNTVLTLLEREVERARRHSEVISLLMLDLDDFKQVNDNLGHQKGDEVLLRLSDIIRETIRSMDIAGRYGGEEFTVILPETDITAAMQSAERLREIIEERFHADLQLTVSMGLACFPDDGNDVTELVKAADEALYKAKADGKNRCVAAGDANKLKN